MNLLDPLAKRGIVRIVGHNESRLELGLARYRGKPGEDMQALV